MLAKKKPPVTEGRKLRGAVARPKIPFVTLLRMFALGSVAIFACVYAIWRYYTTPYQKMLVPVPTPSTTEVEIEWLPPPADSK